jgi:3-hydroxyisobutyrate dehydrogenase
MKIGMAGMGRMGAAMAGRLAGLGHAIMVWNRTPDKALALEPLGIKVAAAPSELAARADIVITMLTDAAALQPVYDGLLSGDAAGKLFIEMSTVRPETHKALARRVRAKGAAYIECPVGGSVGPAKEGKLFGFVGGDAPDVERARPILEQLCRRVEHVGPVGAGASMKLAINLPLMVYWQVLGEALALCAPLAIHPARLMEIFADTSGAPNALKVRGNALAAVLSGKGSGPTTFDVDSMRKDMRSMLEEARSLGRSLPVTERALQCIDEAARAGLGAADCTALPARWMKLAEPK